VAQVRYLRRPAGGDGEFELVATLDGDPAQPHKGSTFAAQLEFPRGGQWEVFAEMDVQSRPRHGETESRQITLESGVCVARIREKLDPGTARYGADPGQNLIPKARASATASSQHGKEKPGHVHDGNVMSHWRCGRHDASPTLELKLGRRTRANLLLFSHPLTKARQRGDSARATRVEVVVNGDEGDAIVVDVDPHPQRKAEIPLTRNQGIKTLRLRVLEVDRGEVGDVVVGFSEVELQNRR
jgi:hypothetical protein